jgi:hypothetical protein
MNTMWKVVSSTSLHNLQTGFSLKMPIVCRCFLRLQWPVISTVTALICVLLNRKISAANDCDGLLIIILACFVCDLLHWSNVSCCSPIHAEMDLWAVLSTIMKQHQ